jgi:hypothetical protein
LALGHFENRQFAHALGWVEEYAEPVPENLAWPVVKGYLVAAKVKAGVGQTFDAMRRLNIAVEKTSGLGRVAALHTLSELIQEKPDLKGALDFEKRVLSAANIHFKRKEISESAGLEPPKEGHKTWSEWKPVWVPARTL